MDKNGKMPALMIGGTGQVDKVVVGMTWELLPCRDGWDGWLNPEFQQTF